MSYCPDLLQSTSLHNKQTFTVAFLGQRAYKCTDPCSQWHMQEPSDPGEVHHSEANQEQQGERAPPGVPA